MKRLSTITFLTLTLVTSSNAIANETAYVTDNLTITLRTGESLGHQVIRELKSGARLTVIESHDETGYSHVTLEDGTDGWVLTRLLSNTPGAQQQLQETQSTLKKTRDELKKAQEQLSDSNSARHSSDQSLQQLQQENEKLTQELKHLQSISGNAVAMDNENNTLKTNQLHLETEIDALKQQNSVLEDRSARNWFITGTGVMILGMLIGLITPRLRWRKKSSWGEL